MQKITYTNSYGASISFGGAAPYYLISIDASSVGLERGTQKALGQDGATTTSSYYNQRTIICDLAFVGINNRRYDDATMRRHWQHICSVLMPHDKGTLTYTHEAGTYKIDCYPEELPTYDRVIGTQCRFKLNFVADSPYWLSNVPFINRLGQVVGGKRYPLRYPLRFGEWVKTAKIVNDTNLHLPVIVTINSAATHIIITNTTTGEHIEVDTPLDEHQSMIIDTGRYTVEVVTYDEGGQEISREYANYKITLDSRYWQLAPGTNEISLDNGYPDTTAAATISYHRRYLGV